MWAPCFVVCSSTGAPLHRPPLSQGGTESILYKHLVVQAMLQGQCSSAEMHGICSVPKCAAHFHAECARHVMSSTQTCTYYTPPPPSARGAPTPGTGMSQADDGLKLSSCKQPFHHSGFRFIHSRHKSLSTLRHKSIGSYATTCKYAIFLAEVHLHLTLCNLKSLLWTLLTSIANYVVLRPN